MAFAKANTGLFVIFRYGTHKTHPRLFFRYPPTIADFATVGIF